MKPKYSLFLLVIAGVIVASLGNISPQDVTKAMATLQPASNSQVKGTVTFTKSGDDVQVVADVTGLKPGKHGFHIHEKGDCSAPDAASAGAHFNPTHQHHGGPTTPPERHTGDLG